MLFQFQILTFMTNSLFGNCKATDSVFFANQIKQIIEMLLWRIRRNFAVDLAAIYKAKIEEQGMNYDQKQVKVIRDLQTLNDNLISTHFTWKKFANELRDDPPPQYKDMTTQQQKNQRKKNFFNFFSRQFSTAQPLRVKGIYLYGSSGCGKSFLSDMFYDNLAIQEKTKIHFHQFMANIHADLFKLEKEKKAFDPLFTVAKKHAKRTRLLYLDEFQVTDVADASILRRLFERLLNNQLVLLATSNRRPQDLYKNGHQRQFFLPFIDFINQRCEVIDINSQKDYRYDMQKDEGQSNTSYLSPIDEISDSKIEKIAKLLSGSEKPIFEEIEIEPVPGRKLKIPRSCNGVCMYYFHELMENVMGDSDFRAICKQFKAIIIRNMRQIKRNERNTANRLIKLFDEAYYRNVKVYIEATVGIDDLIKPLSEKQATAEEDFALIRCKSRLMEFQTAQYKERLSWVETEGAGISY